ncbi:MAG: leucine efflux protein LeuE [Nocardioides sp.]|uniref:leucine efflux protein LeuE n=1 Tax=Nocardioides sp. TaxID=35761 RepID=UPI003F0B7A3F
MLGVVDLPTYLIGLVLIVLLPGPNSVYVLSVAARRGVGAGYQAAAGVWTGDAVLMVLSAAGVASLLRANDLLFGVVRWAGAAYLAYLAFGMLRGAWQTWRRRNEVEQLITAPSTPASAGVESPYRRALVVSLLNPKAILFFVAFFVQFVDPAYAHPVVSFAFLGLLCQLVSALYLSVLIFTGTRLAASFRRRRRLAAGATSAVGAAFLAFAVKLTLA